MRLFHELGGKKAQINYDAARQALQYVSRTLPYGAGNKKEASASVLGHQKTNQRIRNLRSNSPQVSREDKTPPLRSKGQGQKKYLLLIFSMTSQ